MFYDENSASVYVEAKELSELAEKSGIIDSRHPVLKRPSDAKFRDEKMIKKIYRGIEGYCAFDESLSFTHKFNDLYYTVEGTVDVIYKQNYETRVDMILSVSKYDYRLPPKSEWISYLKLCALLVSKRDNLSHISLRLYIVFSNGDDTSVKHYDYNYTIEELMLYFNSALKKINCRGISSYNRVRYGLPSAASCLFPYNELREGQEIMIKEAYSSIKHGNQLFLEAPTGTGKTVASLYPAVRALGNGLVDKIFYLTSKASTRREAFRGAAKLFDAGAKLRTIVIGAKEQVCMCPARFITGTGSNHCNPLECSYSNGYYNKVENAISELLSSSHGYTVKQIREVAKKYEVCPYELSLDLSELCDIVICDYNYAFDPSVYFRRYFSGEAPKNIKYVFLIDEAHNLVDRAREMYSSTIESSRFLKLYSALSIEDKDLRDMFGNILSEISVCRSLCCDTLAVDSDGIERGYYVSNTLVDPLVKKFTEFRNKCESFLKKNKNHILFDSINSLLFDVKKYLTVSEFFDKRFYNCIYVDGENIIIRIFCLDPSYILGKLQ